MIDSVDDAVRTSKEVEKDLGSLREIYVAEHVLREMLENGAREIGLNQPRLISPKADGRVYEHTVEFRRRTFTCYSENKV